VCDAGRFRNMKVFYDLHIHSTLSPCGDDDMTVNNIAGMASLNGLDIIALTDHNTAKNCPAFLEACKKNGVFGITGMELTTAEEIHVVCLFPTLEDTMAFDEEVYSAIPNIKNRPDVFGNQFILDGEDNVIGTEEKLLLTATSYMLDDAVELVKKYNGVCYPAHIDRESNGIVSILGAFPESPYFGCYELNDGNNREEYESRFPFLKEKPRLVSSDAHYLWNINERVNSLELPETDRSPRTELLEFIRSVSK